MARILIVEDEIVAAQRVQEFLENSEHTIVATVDTGSKAIEIASTSFPDLILMDIYLKDEIDGIAAADHISQRWEIPIIYLSANTEDGILQRAIATAPFGYLVKPFNQVELHSAINIALHRHRLEKQLEQTEQWLTTTLISIGDGTIATDREGRITFMNPVAEDITGWRQVEALGVSANQVLNLHNPETHEAIVNPLLRAMQEGKNINLNQCVLRTKNGTERVIGDSAAPIRDRQGNILGSVLVFQDITHRKQAEDLLYQREQEFRALVENSPDIVARFDRQLRHLYVNPSIERITGIPAAAFMGRTNREVGMPEDLIATWEMLMNQVFNDGQERTIEFEAVTVNGFRYFQSRVVPEFSKTREIVSLLSVTRDITDRKQVEEALRLQAEREQLLGAIAQRIRESLELEDILNTAVSEVRQLLHVDRVLVYRFLPNWSGYVIVESMELGWISLLGREIYDPCMATEACILPFTRGRVAIVDDVQTAGLAECYVNLLSQFQIRANLVLPIMESEHLWGLMAVQQCSAPRHWEEWEVDFLTRLSTNLSIALQQSELYRQTQQLAQREQSLNRVIQSVHNSLDLTTIFNTAISEIGRLLQVDQANILQYLPEEGVWVHLATYCQNPIQTPYLGLEIPDEGNPHTATLKQGEIVRVDNATTLEDEFSQILAETFPGAWLSVPFRIGNSIWGNIGLVKHEQPFVWQDWQVELTCTIADQVAIAIHQSELYTEVQRLNTDLENQVLERTALLQQALTFEALLKRITDKVRDSLDENQILQTAVDELGQGLEIEYCGAAIYSADLISGVITHEYSRHSALVANNRRLQLYNEPTSAVYQQLLRAQYCQFCLAVPNPVRSIEENHTILACPMMDDQGVLGDLWLFKPTHASFNAIEIRLVEQVANQCAIALRQSRLFQSAQAQVHELERLGRLKDDFLSTISHELRTPMSSIKMSIQMLEIVLQPLGVLNESSGAATRYFQILQTECDREIELIDKLLNLSRLDAETEPLILSTINPQTWISHAVEPFLEKIRTQQQSLELNLADDLPPLVTDLPCLGQILNELLVNACKYTPADGIIRISAQTTPDALELNITNTGVEIPAEEIPRIFDKFYRIPSHDPWRHGGTGIGLALVKKLVAHIGATIRTESADGQTTFTVTFPTRQDAE